MKKLKLMSLALALMMMSASAAEITKNTYNRDTNIAVVEGTSSEENVTIRVRKSGNVYYEMQTESTDGKFTFNFPMKGTAATYDIEIGETGLEAPVPAALIFYGEGSLDYILTAVNKAIKENDPDALKKAVSDDYEKLGLSQDVTTLSTDVYKLMINLGECGGLEAICENVETAAMLIEFNESATAEAFEVVVEKNAEMIATELPTVYKTYLDNTEVCEVLASKEFDTPEEFYEVFAFETMRYAIKNAGGWADAEKIIKDNETFLKVDMSAADGIEEKNELYIRLMNTSFSEIGDIATAYASIVKDIKDENKKDDDDKPSSGGGGGGGGGSYQNSSVYMPPMQSITAAKDAFADMQSAEWAKAYVNELYAEGIVSGDGKNFRPNDSVLREEFIKMLVLSLDIPITAVAESFIDVPADAWYKNYVDTVKAKEISTGKGDNTFGVGENISRQDLVTLAFRAAKLIGVELEAAESTFTDKEEIADYAKDAVNAFSNAKIVNGKEDGSFSPADTATRAETAKILYLLREKVKSANYAKQ